MTVYRTNLSTNPQPATATGWLAGPNAALTQAPWSPARLLYTFTSTGSGVPYTMSDTVALTAGQTVYWRAKVWASNADHLLALRIRGAADDQDTRQTWRPPAAGGWTELSGQTTATATRTYRLTLIPVLDNGASSATPAAGYSGGMGDVIISTKPGPYFDGSTPHTSTRDYRWTDAPNASTSEETDYTPPPEFVGTKITAVSVKIGKPGTADPTSSALNVNTLATDQVITGETPSAVESMTMTWGQPTSRDHPTPGSLSGVLIMDTPTHAQVDYESPIHVHVTLDDGSPIQVWRGWLDTIRIRRRVVHHPDTRQPVVTWRWEITAIDVIGRAAATKIGANPWPYQTTRPRLKAIRAACPVPLIDPAVEDEAQTPELTIGGALNPPMDVDNRDVLPLVQATSMACLLWVQEGPAGLIPKYGPGLTTIKWTSVGGLYSFVFIGEGTPEQPWDKMISTPYAVTSNGIPTYPTPDPDPPNTADAFNAGAPPVDMSARVVTDADRAIDRGSILTQVTIAWRSSPVNDNAPKSVTDRRHVVRRAGRTASTSEHVLQTDYWAATASDNPSLADETGTAARALIQHANALLDQTGTPTRVLDVIDVLLDRATADQVAPLITLGERGVQALRLSDAPGDIPGNQRVVGGTLTLGVPHALTLTVEPVNLAGLKPLTWNDIPAAGTRPQPTSGSGTTSHAVLFDTIQPGISWGRLALASTASSSNLY